MTLADEGGAFLCDTYMGTRSMKTRKLVLVALVLATFQTAAHAGLSEGAHRFKEDVKQAGRNIGHGAREAAHATVAASKKVGHAVANTARHGYHATKNAIHNVGNKTKTRDKTMSNDAA